MSDVFLTFTHWTIDYPWAFWVLAGGILVLFVIAIGAAYEKW